MASAFLDNLYNFSMLTSLQFWFRFSSVAYICVLWLFIYLNSFLNLHSFAWPVCIFLFVFTLNLSSTFVTCSYSTLSLFAMSAPRIPFLLQRRHPALRLLLSLLRYACLFPIPSYVSSLLSSVFCLTLPGPAHFFSLYHGCVKQFLFLCHGNVSGLFFIHSRVTQIVFRRYGFSFKI